MFIKIIAALIYDILIIFALSLGVTAIELLLCKNTLASHTLSHQLSLVGMLFAYYSFSLINGGQTIGLRAWQLKIITKNGRITLNQSIKRFCLLLPACLWAFFSRKKLHTILFKWTNTYLISVS